MRCNRAKEYLSMELDNVLPPDSTLELRDHLDHCAECVAYREDLQMGRRLLDATEPTLPDNFDWKLQLQLNQALKETAGEISYPWIEDEDKKSWLGNFLPAAAVGMAAVLALAIVLGPVGSFLPSEDTAPQTITQSSDRLPLGSSNFGASRLSGRPVSSRSPFQPVVQGRTGLNRGWSGENLEDLRTINHLRRENEKLSRMLLQSQRQMELMRAPLDTTRDKDLNLGTE